MMVKFSIECAKMPSSFKKTLFSSYLKVKKVSIPFSNQMHLVGIKPYPPLINVPPAEKVKKNL